MATAKLAIWLELNGRPLPIKAQNTTTSAIGGSAAATSGIGFLTPIIISCASSVG